MRRIAAILFAVLIFPLPGKSQPPPPASGQSIPAQIDINGNLLPVARYGNPLNLPSGSKLNGTDLQTTLNGKQPLDSDLTAIAALGTTSFGRSFLTLADAAASRTYIGAGTSSFSGLFTGLDFTSSNLTSIATRNFTDLQNKPVFYVKDYGAVGNGTTDDTVAIQAAITAAQAVNGKVVLDSKTYKITDTLVISSPIEFGGNFVTALYGDRSVFGSDVLPTQSPYLAGSVLLMTTAAKNAIKVTVVGASDDISNFGIRFADSIKFANTGHGILFDPGTYLTYKNNGVSGGHWKNVYVYGQDGNHYAFYVINAQYIAASNLEGFGGGGLAWEVNTAAGWYGNSTITDPYFCTAYAGTAHGYYLHNIVSAHGVILMNFVRPQSFFFANFGNPDPPTGSQYCFYADDDTTYLTVTAADMEDGPVRLPTDLTHVAMWTSGHTGGAQPNPILYGRPYIAGSNTGSGITYPNGSSTGGLEITPINFQDGASLFLYSGLRGGGLAGYAYLTFGSSARDIAGRQFRIQDASTAGIFDRLVVDANQIAVSSAPNQDGSLVYNILSKNTSTAYNASPSVGLDFQTKYNSAGDLAGLGGLSVGKENTTDGDYSGFLAFHTRRNGSAITEKARISSQGGFSLGSTIDPGAGNLLLNGLTASSFLEADASKVLVSKTAAQMRTDLGLVIGTNVQAWDADIDALAALTGTHTLYYRSAANTWSAVTIGTGLDFTGATLSATATGGSYLTIANNLSDLNNAATARQNLGTFASKHVAKSANFSVAAADAGTIFDVTTGASAITVTLDTAVNLGTNFQCLIRKVDSGAGTVTANSQQIGKLNHWIEIDSDGTTVRSKTIQGGFDGIRNYTLRSPGSITLSPGAGSTLGSNWTWNGVAIGNSYLATTLSSKTLDDTNSYTAKDGSFTLENTTTVSKKAVFDLSNISTSTTRTVNIPDANSTTAQAKSAVSNQFLTAMSAQGVFTSAQPAIANLSDAGTLATWAGTTPASGVMTFLGTPSSANLAAAITNETGSGALVFGTSPSITTGINDANGNSMLAFTATGSAVDGFTFTNAATANPATVTMAATGSDSNISLQLTPKGTGVVIVNGGVISPASGDIKLRGASSGNIRFENNSGTLESYVETTSGGFVIQNNAGLFRFGGGDSGFERVGAGALRVINGTTGQLGSLSMGVRDSGTTTVTNGLTIGHQSTGTPAAGLGSGILFNINSSTTADQNAAQIAALWTDATHATRTSDVTISTVNSAAALAESFRVKATGGISWNGGAVFKKVLAATATLDFPSTAAGVSNDLTITVTGAAVGDVVSIGVPDGSTGTHSDYSAWVSATDTVKVRFLNGGATLDPASGTFRAQVNQF